VPVVCSTVPFNLMNKLLLLLGGWNDSRYPYGMPSHVGNGGPRVVPQTSQPGLNVVDDNSFLGHEVGAWKGSEASWRGDDPNRTLTPRPEDGGPGLVHDMPQDSFRIVGSDLSFTAGDGNWKPPVRDEPFHNGRVPREYDSNQQRGFADMRPSNGRAAVDDWSQQPGRLINGTGDRYPAIQDAWTVDGATGLDMTSLKL